MNHSALSFIIAKSSLEAIPKFLSSPKNAEIYNGAIILLLVLLGAGLSWGFVRLMQSFSTRHLANPRKLFVQLCRAHQLSTGERRQLEQLAELNGLSTPALLMVDASLWKLDELARVQKIQLKQKERFLTLQKTLYDQPRLTVDRLPPS